MDQVKARILVLVADATFSYSNKNSAVANYLNTLVDALYAAGAEVQMYPEKSNTVLRDSTVQNKKKRIDIRSLVRTLSPRIYYTILARKKIKYTDHVLSQILSSHRNFDLIIEFLTIGSSVAYDLKKKTATSYIAIYDSPLVEQFEDMYGTKSFLKKRLAKAERETCENADGLICYSKSVANFVAKKYYIKNPIFTLPCVVWKDELFAQSNKPQTIGFIGSFLSWHKVDLLVDAFFEIALEFPNANLVLVGYGQEWNQIHQKVQSSKYHDRIEMPGFVSEEKLNNYKKRMLIGVMPGSNWYGSPLKLFEYAQSSIAIIAPETPVVVDLFSREEALFIDKNNSYESLVQNIRILLQDDILRNRMIESANLKMKGDFSKGKLMKQFIQIIENTLSGGITK